MKKFISFVIVLFFVIYPLTRVQSDCDEAFYDQCAVALGEFSFLKSFQLDEKLVNKYGIHPKIKYSSVFSKGSEYLITICDEKKESDVRMVLKLFLCIKMAIILI